MRQIVIDFETYSEVPLKTRRLANYVRHSSFEVLCMAYCIDAGKVRVWTPGDPFPEAIERAMYGLTYLCAFNAEFEYAVWKHYCTPRLRWPDLEGTHWQCIQARCLAEGLPDSLALAAKVDCPKEYQKFETGKNLIAKLCCPQKKGPRNTPQNSPDDFKKLYQYCAQDVVAARTLLNNRIDLQKLPHTERQIWLHTLRNNLHGVKVDTTLAANILALINFSRIALNTHLTELTGGDVERATQTQRLLNFVKKTYPKVPDLTKDTVDGLLALKDLDVNIRKCLRIRKAANLTSTAKYQTIFDTAHKRRIHSFMWYHKAVTGRFASGGFQFHNLPKISLSESDEAKAIEIINTTDLTAAAKLKRLRAITDHATIFKALIRACVLPESDHFIVADYSSIEFLIMIWLANDVRALVGWEQQRDFYKVMAARIFKIKVADVNPQQRTLGKLAMLGCQYGMSASKFEFVCRSVGLKINASLAARTVQEYRSEFSAIKDYWDCCFDLASGAMRSPGKVVRIHRLAAKFTGGCLVIRLPSKRCIFYRQARLTESHYVYGREVIEYQRSAGRTWLPASLTGTTLTENLVQAIARDVLVDGILKLEAAGGRVRFHVHDEVIVEDLAESRVKEALTTPPEWAARLAIRVESAAVKRYRKI